MIFENPFKYRRKWDRRKMSRISLGISITAGILVLGTGIAAYFTTVPPPIPLSTADIWAVFDTGTLQEIRKKIAINAAFFSQTAENTPGENPNQEIIDQRIRSLRKLPPLSEKPFLFAALASGTNPIREQDIAHVQKLDMVFPDWFTLVPSWCTVRESIDWNTSEILNKNRIITIPRFSNTAPLGWKTDFSDILRTEGQWTCLIDDLKKNIKNRSVKGINIDLADIPAIDRNRYTAWLLSLTESFHRDDLSVMVTVPIGNAAFDYKNIGMIADFVIVKAYDEHSLIGVPGPIAGMYWFEHSLDALLKTIPPSKTIVALGLHGYDWNLSTGISPERRNFDTTMRLVENTEASIRWDAKSQNNTFSYVADDGSYHEAWFLDAVSVWNQYMLLGQKQVYGMSLAFMGDEDSSIWKFIYTGALNTFDPRALSIPTREGVRELAFSGKTIIRSDYLRLPKDSTISYDTILGISRDSFQPLIPVGERLFVLWDIFTSNIKQWIWYFLVTLFIVTTVVSISRIIFLGIFVFRSNTFRRKCFPRKFLHLPPVTILVPAYNEEKVIKRTIVWLLSSKYPKFEILVIDDGSTDKTAEYVRRLMKKYQNVRLISKRNEGKSLALNVGFREAKHDYVVTVDADTIVLPKTIHYLMEPFSDSRVDAVCGNIWVGNVKNILTAFQEVEYVTGQNYDRHAFDALNCISVVPGATGAWKKQRVLDIGGYSGDTLVEDADLTLTLLENGGRIVYAPLARSVTEAPEKVDDLFKQRFRWSYGTFQCFWKHRRTFGKGTLGIIALPNMILFQVIFPLLCPIGDIVLVAALFLGNLQPILVGYVLFFVMDALASGTAYALDKKSIVHIWVIFIQRFFYRQFMYFVTFKSIIAALNGSRHGWNKLERKGTVKVIEIA